MESNVFREISHSDSLLIILKSGFSEADFETLVNIVANFISDSDYNPISNPYFMVDSFS